MARAYTASRYSRTADRPAPASHSPFHSYRPSRREIGAHQMVEKRETELAALEGCLRTERNPREQKRLAQRILATKNNLESWLDYLEEGAYRVQGAVIVPD